MSQIPPTTLLLPHVFKKLDHIPTVTSFKRKKFRWYFWIVCRVRNLETVFFPALPSDGSSAFSWSLLLPLSPFYFLLHFQNTVLSNDLVSVRCAWCNLYHVVPSANFPSESLEKSSRHGIKRFIVYPFFSAT